MNVGTRNSRSISILCSLLGYSRQSYYQRCKALELEVLQTELIIQQVLMIREDQRKVGTRKLLIHLEPFFKAHNISIGRDALFTLLADNKLLIRRRNRRNPITTFSRHWMRKYPNLIIGMRAVAPHQIWVSDITYIALGEREFGYLSLVTDAYSRKIIGHYLCKDLSTEGCIKALRKAIKQLPANTYPIHHSDRGCQYCSFEYVNTLIHRGLQISMTQSGDPLENAIAERVNGIIKEEFLSDRYINLKEAQKAVDHAVSVYNNIRLHLSLNMITPTEAHLREGELKRQWKAYYTKIEKEVMSHQA